MRMIAPRSNFSGARSRSQLPEKPPRFARLEGAGLHRILVILTADHGCDPTTPSTDHSREYTPLIAFGPRVRPGVDLGLRATLLGEVAAIYDRCLGDRGEAAAAYRRLLDVDPGNVASARPAAEALEHDACRVLARGHQGALRRNRFREVEGRIEVSDADQVLRV